MDLTIATNPALTALFIGLIWTLIKVVSYFIEKRADGSPSLAKRMEEQVQKICATVEKNNKIIKDLYELHDVRDENYVPRWYVPTEIITLLKEIRSLEGALDIQIHDVKTEILANLSENKIGQTAVLEKVTDLIHSQKAVIEKLTEFIVQTSRKH